MNDTDKLLRTLIDTLGFDIVFATTELVHQPSIPLHVIVEYKLVKRESKIKEELATWKELHDSWRYS